MLTTLLTFVSLANGPIVVKGPSLDPCALATADASATLGADVDFRELKSNGAQYAAKIGCIWFVADFIVPPDANPASEYGVLDFDLTGGYATLPSDAASCTGSGVTIMTYKRAAGTKGFTKRSEASYHAEWSSSGFSYGCRFVKALGANPPSDRPDPAGTEVWRMVVRGGKNFTAQPVKATIAFRQIPK